MRPKARIEEQHKHRGTRQTPDEWNGDQSEMEHSMVGRGEFRTFDIALPGVEAAPDLRILQKDLITWEYVWPTTADAHASPSGNELMRHRVLHKRFASPAGECMRSAAFDWPVHARVLRLAFATTILRAGTSISRSRAIAESCENT